MKKAIVTLYEEINVFSLVISDKSEDNALFDYLIKQIKLALCGEVIDDGKVLYLPLQKNHIYNIETLKQHIAKSSPNLNLPKFNAIIAWLEKIGEGKFFGVCFNREPPIEEVFAIHATIGELNGGEKMEVAMSEINNIAGDMFSNYDVKASDPNNRVLYGEEPFGSKVCRYCHLSESVVTFHKVAHTISEGLGNKFTITYNECDRCNEYFGKTCEPDFIAYLDILRPFFHVKGKDGEVKKVEGKNFIVQNDAIDENLLKIQIKQKSNPFNETEGSFKFELEHSKKIIPLNIYKALVKFAYGIIPNNYLEKFTFTADWLLGKKVIEKLPLVMLSQGKTYIKHPRVMIYIRKNERTDLPFAIGEFRVMNNIFVYIIPTEVNNSFRDKQEWEVLIKQIFRYYGAINWWYKDFSSVTPQQMNFHLNIEKRNR